MGKQDVLLYKLNYIKRRMEAVSRSSELKDPINKEMSMEDCIYFIQRSYDLISIKLVETKNILFQIKPRNDSIFQFMKGS